jgi:glycerol uptake facilitator-like aquaporin
MLEGSASQTREPASLAPPHDVTRNLAAEALGSGFLAFAAVAAGILAERYSGGNIGLATLMTALAVAGAFAALSLGLRGQAATYFNPGLAFALALLRKIPLASALLSGAAQMAAAMIGVMLAHIVTNTGLVQIATQIQHGHNVWIGEFLASAFFVFVLLRLMAIAPRAIPLTGALCMLAAVLATPSLSLANPALTLARGLTDSFTSIRLGDAGLILICQFAAALAASLLNLWLFAEEKRG